MDNEKYIIAINGRQIGGILYFGHCYKASFQDGVSNEDSYPNSRSIIAFIVTSQTCHDKLITTKGNDPQNIGPFDVLMSQDTDQKGASKQCTKYKGLRAFCSNYGYDQQFNAVVYRLYCIVNSVSY